MVLPPDPIVPIGQRPATLVRGERPSLRGVPPESRQVGGRSPRQGIGPVLASIALVGLGLAQSILAFALAEIVSAALEPFTNRYCEPS
jgi:hypothetical protein